MDDTQQNTMNPQPASDGLQPSAMPDPSAPVVPAMDSTMQPASSMGDLAGMTPPPPAPMQDMSAPAPVAMPEPAPVPSGMMDTSSVPSTPASPVGDMSMVQPLQASADVNGLSSSPMPAPAPVANGEADDYAYAEDLLDEILDSLDRIEAKLEAIEKKMGQ